MSMIRLFFVAFLVIVFLIFYIVGGVVTVAALSELY